MQVECEPGLLRLLKHNDKLSRCSFTSPERNRILIIADTEWRGMILFGRYTGQRLEGIDGRCWFNFDLERREIHLTTGKSDRRQMFPLASSLLRCFSTVSVCNTPETPLFPNSYTIQLTFRS